MNLSSASAPSLTPMLSAWKALLALLSIFNLISNLKSYQIQVVLFFFFFTSKLMIFPLEQEVDFPGYCPLYHML